MIGPNRVRVAWIGCVCDDHPNEKIVKFSEIVVVLARTPSFGNWCTCLVLVDGRIHTTERVAPWWLEGL